MKKLWWLPFLLVAPLYGAFDLDQQTGPFSELPVCGPGGVRPGTEFAVNDATTTTTCNAGSGTATAVCTCGYNGAVYAWAAAAGGSGAPTTAPYVTTAADAGLSAEMVLQAGTNTTVGTGAGTVQINVAGAPPTGSATGDLTGTYPAPTVAANAVALTTDTTGNYALGDAEAGNAVGLVCTTCVDATDIASNAVTLPKIVNATTNNRLFGRATAGSGNWEEITLGTNLSYTGTTLNAAGGGTAGWDSETHVVTSDFTTTSTSASGVDVTGMTFALTSGGIYEFEVVLQVTSSSAAGIQAGMGLSGTGTVQAYSVGATNSGNGGDSGFSFTGAGGGLGNASLCSVTSTECIVWMRGIARPSAAGNLTARVNKVTSGTTTVRIGSLMKVRRIL